MWVPAGNNRFTWEADPDGAGRPDEQRPRRLVDPGDGSLIEADGATVLRYASAYLDTDGLIVNESGQCQVVQNSGWRPFDEAEFWSLMEQVSDSDHPFWEDAREQGGKPAPNNETPTPRVERITDEGDPDAQAKTEEAIRRDTENG